MHQLLGDFERNHPSCTIDDITGEFGTPEQIAEEMMDGITTQEICRVNRGYRILLLIFGTLTALIVVSFLFFALHLNKDSQQQYYVTETIVVYGSASAPAQTPGAAS